MRNGPVEVVVAGAAGKMGEAVARAALADPGFRLAGLLEARGHPAVGSAPYGAALRVGDDAGEVLARGRVLIEFTTPEGAAALAGAAARAGAPLVSGTTGLGRAAEAAFAAAAERVAVVQAPNLSRGVAFLSEIAARAARALPDFDLEIVERHHRDKKDAPSGTALALAAVIAAARGLDATAFRHGRQGNDLRTREEIGIHAVRGGDWVGEHTVIFAGPGETIELRHRAESRQAFVRGALVAARFAAAAPPGRYGMAEVLGGADNISRSGEEGSREESAGVE